MNFEDNITLSHLDSIDPKSLPAWLLLLGNSTLNLTDEFDFYPNDTDNRRKPNEFLSQIFPLILVVCYGLVFIVGVAGNCMVIYVVTMFSKMKTVTNIYVVNLAVADVLFLMSMPFLITTAIMKTWVFGYGMCKIYMVLFSINYFTGIFTLTIMSADRYLAVCHPVRSLSIRTPKIAFILCIFIWVASVLTMIPTFLYARTVIKPHKITCSINWPSKNSIRGEVAFIWYGFFFSYAIPMMLISFFYIMVVLRLGKLGPANKQKEKKKSNRRVTKMVLAIIGVYMMCWTPFWALQIILIVKAWFGKHNIWVLIAFQLITLLALANSMMNPFLYNFLSDNFRKSFLKAFKCATKSEVSKSQVVENSLCPRNNQCTEMTKFDEETASNTFEMQIVTTKSQCNSSIVKVENVFFSPAEKETNVEKDKLNGNVDEKESEEENKTNEKENLSNVAL
ncbi:somatostatin receptor type 2-like [Argonauta hians]